MKGCITLCPSVSLGLSLGGRSIRADQCKSVARDFP